MYKFIIDTENYAGNFEREMFAFCTGQIGHCGVGDKEAQLAIKALGKTITGNFGRKISFIADEDGEYRRSVDLCPTPGWFNNGVGGCFKEGQGQGQEAEALVHRNLKHYPGLDPEAPLRKHPCFNSVAILFEELPTEEEIVIMSERANRFVHECLDTTGQPYGITITGFRLLHERVVTDTIWSSLD